MNVRLWLARKLRDHIEASTGGEEIITETVAELRALAVAATAGRLPTFNDAWGCMQPDCGAIQALPKNHRCHVCQSEQIVNLTLQLKRGSQRIANRALEVRRGKKNGS